MQAVKPLVPDSRLYPLLAIMFGLVINLALFWALTAATRVDLVTACFSGIIAGLAASGLYSGVATAVWKSQKHDNPQPPPGK